MAKYLLITEGGLDAALMHRIFDDAGLPRESSERGLRKTSLSPDVDLVCLNSEPQDAYLALIQISSLRELLEAGSYPGDVYSRIARVVKSLRSPPIHLPRPWSEYHFKNLLAFFAVPRASSSLRWIVDTNGQTRCARFIELTSSENPIALQGFEPPPWPKELQQVEQCLSSLRKDAPTASSHSSIVEEVDLQVIGSSSVVRNRTFEGWLPQLTSDQCKILDTPSGQSVRIIGPAGSGKTLALCMKAIKTARSDEVAHQARKILVVAHSWAMAERIDGILNSLSAGSTPASITVLPLLYVLQVHGGQGAMQGVEIIGDDSKEGRIAAIELVQEVLREREQLSHLGNVSKWLSDAFAAAPDSRQRAELAFNLYDEFTGVLSAEGVATDDQESIRKYISASREDWMPPFTTTADRRFVIAIFREFLTKLSDRGAVTTDQFVSDVIRVLETFTWRMKRETEGYDFILIDELQLFDSQERLAVELLARARNEVPFVTAEDPSQGVFSPLHRRQVAGGVDTSVYLQSVHRFDQSIFDLIGFLYQQFPLNTIPLRIAADRGVSEKKPILCVTNDDGSVVSILTQRIARLVPTLSGNQRLCAITLGDVDDELRLAVESENVPVVQLRGFDDVEQLSYRKRSVIVAPWQFVGGTQFSHVIVVCADIGASTTGFGKLRELTSIYLACSRAADDLEVVCGTYVPDVFREAVRKGLMTESQSSA